MRGRRPGDSEFGGMFDSLGIIHDEPEKARAATRAVLLRYERGELCAEETADVLLALGLVTEEQIRDLWKRYGITENEA